jgi:hypothetical protein
MSILAAKKMGAFRRTQKYKVAKTALIILMTLQ